MCKYCEEVIEDHEHEIYYVRTETYSILHLNNGIDYNKDTDEFHLCTNPIEPAIHFCPWCGRKLTPPEDYQVLVTISKKEYDAVLSARENKNV